MYQQLAHYYDALVKDDQATTDYVSFITEFIHGNKGIDFGCGSGEITCALHKLGYEMDGVDLSQDMINELNQKDLGIHTICADMKDVQLNKSYDFALCLCDSFNYLLTDDDVHSFFVNVYNCLNDGGVFVLDSHHINRLDEFDIPWVEEGMIDDTAYQWTIQSNEECLIQHFAFYKDNQVLQEYHQQRVYPLTYLLDTLSNVGFKHIQVFYDFDSQDSSECEKYFLVGEK